MNEELEWFYVSQKLPPQSHYVYVLNGKSKGKFIAEYYRKKWRASWGYAFEDDVILHRVKKWAYIPGCKPSIPTKDFKKFCDQAKKYCYNRVNFRPNPIIGLN